MISLNSLKEFSIDNIGKWPLVIKFTVIILLSLVVCFLGYYWVARGNIEQYNQLASKEKKLRAAFETLQHQASNLPAYRNQIKTMEDRFNHILMQLPAQNETPSLLEDISKTGVASGLTFELFAPAPEVKHDFYVELPIQIVVKGTYHQLAVFLSRVAEMNRIVTLHDFVMETATPEKNLSLIEKKSTNLNDEQLTMKIMATIYRYPTP